ncbi:MAG: hypothetical protein OXN89_04895 [Bryobacterales bacterium]|nr:hypothetical protein [Bryobacterales bacterium]
MSTVVIGGNSREVGKTSLAASLIAATRERGWTAIKLTRFGHGICSRDGSPCGCAIANPMCPYEISRETGAVAGTDTARMLEAGAREVLWVRVAMGELATALPAIREAVAGRSSVLFESNSIVEHIAPEVYISVLRLDVPDCKRSASRLAGRADAFAVSGGRGVRPPWSGFDVSLLAERPIFDVRPPAYCSGSLIRFVTSRLDPSDVLPPRVGGRS